MTLFNLISKELDSGTVSLTEEELLEDFGFKVSPITALLAFKQRVLGTGKEKKKSASGLKKLSAKAKIAKEKFKAKTGSKGKDDNDTFYSFTKEQRSFVAHLYNTYGKEIVAEIEKFRTNILAPYQIIKRQIKENRSLTSKEVNGMSKDDYLKYRESGRKKIEGRANHDKDFSDKSDAHKIAREGYDAAVQELEDFKSGKRTDISDNKMEKVYKLLGYGTDKLQGYPLDEFNRTYRKLQRYLEDSKRHRDFNDDPTTIILSKSGKEMDVDDFFRLVMDTASKGTTRAEKGTPTADYSKEGEGVHKGSFKKGYMVYLLRKNIRDELKNDFSNSQYKKFYIKVLEQIVDEARSKKTELLQGMVKSLKDIELNDMEKKIWGKLPSNLKKHSGDIKDFYLKLKDEDFKDTKHYEIPESMRKAEDAVNKESKRFERTISQIVSSEDLAEMKRLRLINNLITVRELRNPDSLFKSKADLSKSFGDDEEDTNEDNNDEISPTEYAEKIRDYIKATFESLEELDEAKKDIKDLTKQVDSKTAKKYKGLVDQLMSRKDVKPDSLASQYEGGENLVSIGELKTAAGKITNKKYDSVDRVKQDKMVFSLLIKKYRNQNKDADEAELNNLSSMVDRKVVEVQSNLGGN